MSTEELIPLLEREHNALLETLKLLEEAIFRKDAKAAWGIVDGIDETLVQHMIDEEANLLKTLIQVFGKEGSMESIEIFREHVDIDAMIREMKKSIADVRTDQERLLSDLGTLLSAHFRKEHEKVFPCALEASRRLFG